jgi:photosynthetic reaction center cytochrome c subunit
MNSRSRGLSLSLALLGVAATGMVVRAHGQSNPQKPGMGHMAPPDMSKPAEQVYENIQVLKGIPAEQLIPAMQFITASLGVQCEFCHVEGKFDEDDKKPKKIARQMMQMMFAINKDNFDGHRAVTCYSCHRGAAKPVAIPLITAEAAPPPGPPVSEAGEQNPAIRPPTTPIIDKYVAALGGAQAVDKVTSRVEKGTATFGGMQIPIEIYAEAPEKRASIMKIGSAESVTVFDGTSGWLSMPHRGIHEMYGGDLDAAKMDADLHFPTDIANIFPQLHVSGQEKIDDHNADVVIGIRQGEPPVKLYFDEQSGLLLRILRYSDSPLGLNPTQIDYADYRDVDGVKTPFRWTTSRPGNSFTIQVESVQQNVPVDDAVFAKPAPPAGMGQPMH